MFLDKYQRRSRLDEVIPFGPPPDWYETYWMTDRPAGPHLKLRYAAVASLLVLLVAWIV